MSNRPGLMHSGKRNYSAVRFLFLSILLGKTHCIKQAACDKQDALEEIVRQSRLFDGLLQAKLLYGMADWRKARETSAYKEAYPQCPPSLRLKAWDYEKDARGKGQRNNLYTS